MTPRTWQILENALIATAAFMANIALDFPWWAPLALFLAWDLSMVGYLANTRLGAQIYNLVHSYIGPSVLGSVALLSDARWVGLVALAWAFHVGVDRALGYGLKESDDFQHTHLGWIGKKSGRRASESHD